jgi:hypothetical protein
LLKVVGQDGFCPVEKNSEGHDICTITGMCVKMLSFSNEEFVDTACMGSSGNGGGGGGGEEGRHCKDEDDMDHLNRQPSGSCYNHYGEEDGGDNEATLSMYSTSSHLSFKPPTHSQKLGKRKATRALEQAGRQPAERAAATPTVHGGGCPSAAEAANSSCRGRGANNSRSSVCSVNKKNRYRSWVYHRVMHNHNNNNRRVQQQQQNQQLPPIAAQKKANKNQDANRIGDLIQMYVEDVLCGPKWQVSQQRMM